MIPTSYTCAEAYLLLPRVNFYTPQNAVKFDERLFAYKWD